MTHPAGLVIQGSEEVLPEGQCGGEKKETKQGSVVKVSFYGASVTGFKALGEVTFMKQKGGRGKGILGSDSRKRRGHAVETSGVCSG